MLGTLPALRRALARAGVVAQDSQLYAALQYIDADGFAVVPKKLDESMRAAGVRAGQSAKGAGMDAATAFWYAVLSHVRSQHQRAFADLEFAREDVARAATADCHRGAPDA